MVRRAESVSLTKIKSLFSPKLSCDDRPYWTPGQSAAISAYSVALRHQATSWRTEATSPDRAHEAGRVRARRTRARDRTRARTIDAARTRQTKMHTHLWRDSAVNLHRTCFPSVNCQIIARYDIIQPRNCTDSIRIRRALCFWLHTALTHATQLSAFGIIALYCALF